MDLKLKLVTLKRNIIVSKYRKIKQLIRLYTDYIDFIKDEYKAKTDKKIQHYKDRRYAEYQAKYFDVADEREIFDVVYAHKYEELKHEFRMEFRVVREELRREAAIYTKQNVKLAEEKATKSERLEALNKELALPLDPELDIAGKFRSVFKEILNELNGIEVGSVTYSTLTKEEREKATLEAEQIKERLVVIDDLIIENAAEAERILSLIPIEEKKSEVMREAAAKAIVDEFESQARKAIDSNSEEELQIYKTSIEEDIKNYSDIEYKALEQRCIKKEAKILAKIEKLKAKEVIYEEKVQDVILELSELDSNKNLNSSNAKETKLLREIETYQARYDAATSNDEKVKYEKILNSLNGDLSILQSNKPAIKEDLIKDDEVLAVKDLCMYFGGIKAVNHLNFSVKKNEIFGLIGPNGAGKTTVFNCITQFYKPTGGQIVFRNKNNEIVDLTKEKVHNVILHGIVRTFQNLEVIKDITVLDNLLIAAHRDFTSGLFKHMIHSTLFRVEEKVITQRAIKVLEFMGLLKYKDMYAWGLPYGILKKIEIARTLMCNPQLIILDEPAAGLNDSETVELSALIRRIRDEYNSTILLVEHDMGLVMDVCDRICAISFGNLLALGTPKEIQQDKGVQEAYLGVSED